MNWYWTADGIFGDVKPTDEAVDGEFVFSTFASARKALADHFVSMAEEYRWSAREARKLRKPKTA
jgi:hypothetical protein